MKTPERRACRVATLNPLHNADSSILPQNAPSRHIDRTQSWGADIRNRRGQIGKMARGRNGKAGNIPSVCNRVLRQGQRQQRCCGRPIFPFISAADISSGPSPMFKGPSAMRQTYR